MAGNPETNLPQDFDPYKRFFIKALLGMAVLPKLDVLEKLFEWLFHRRQGEPDPDQKPEKNIEKIKKELSTLSDPNNRFKLDLGVNPPPTNPTLETPEITEITPKENDGYPCIIPHGNQFQGTSLMEGPQAPWVIIHSIPSNSMEDPSRLQINAATDGEKSFKGKLLGSSFSLFVQGASAIQKGNGIIVTLIVYDNYHLWSETQVLAPNSNQIDNQDNQLKIIQSFPSEATFGTPVIANIVFNGKKHLVIMVAEDKYGEQYFGESSPQILLFDLDQTENNNPLLGIKLPYNHWFNGNDQIAVYEGKDKSFIAVPLRDAQSEPRVDPNDPPKKTSIAIYAPHTNTKEPVIIDLQGEPTEIGWIDVNNQPTLVVASKYKNADNTVRGKLSFYNHQGEEINVIQSPEIQSINGQDWFRFTNIALVNHSKQPFLLATGATDYMENSLLVKINLATGKMVSFEDQIEYCHYGIITLPTSDGLLIATVGYDKNNNPGINAGFIDENNNFAPLPGFPLPIPCLSLNRPAFAIDPTTGKVALVVSARGDEETTIHSFDITDYLPENVEPGWSQFGGNTRGTRQAPSEPRKGENKIYIPNVRTD